MTKLAIVDHVGTKAGMDYYSLQLRAALQNCGGDVRLYSNFRDAIVRDRVTKTFPNLARTPLNTFVSVSFGFLYAAIRCLFENRKVVLTHFFSSSFFDVICIGMLWLCRRRIFLIVHDPESLEGRKNAKWAIALVSMFAEKYIVHNSHSREVFSRSISPTLHSRIYTVPHGNFLGYSETGVLRDHARNFLNLQKDKKYILFFGQIKQSKGLDILIRALSHIQDESVKLIIAGRPWKTDFDTYDSLIASLGLEQRIEKMIRYISDQERDFLFHASDILVIPYRKIFQSGVLIMGMSYSLPIVASSLPANLELKEKCEWIEIFSSGNDIELASKIVRFIEDPGHAERCATKGFEFIKKNHSWEIVASKIWSLI